VVSLCGRYCCCCESSQQITPATRLLLQTFQLDADHEQGGEWYHGSVEADARISRPHSEVASDPYGCGGLWERYKVQWDDEDTAGDVAEDAAGDAAENDVPQGDKEPQQIQQQQGLAEAQPHAAAAAAGAEVAAAGGAGDDSWLSPWELYAAGQSSEAVLAAEHTTQLTGEQVMCLSTTTAVWFRACKRQ
jgi:hypothetical protein